MEFNRNKILIIQCILGMTIFLSGCASEKLYYDKEGVLQKKGIYLDISEEKRKEDYFDVFLNNLTSFCQKVIVEGENVRITDEPKDESGEICILSQDLSLSFDDYYDIYKEMIGNQCDAGMSQAVVSYIVSGYKVEKNVDLSTLIKEENSYILDFSLPIMEKVFVSEDNSETAKEMALRFCAYIDSVYGFEKLIELSKSNIDDPEKIKLKNEWLKSIGSGVEYSPAAPYVFVCNEGNDKDEYPYYIPSESYDLYLATADIKDEDYRDFFWYYLKTSEYWEEDMRDAREVYFGSNRDVPKVKMYTCFTKSPGHSEFAGEYNDDKIYLYGSFQNAVIIFTHEYTHHLQKEENSKSSLRMIPHVCAMNEGYADELCNYEYRRVAFNSLFDKEEIRKAGLWDEANDCVNLGLMTDAEAYIEASREGIPYLSVSYTNETTDDSVKPYIYLSYSEMASLVHYLKATKGEELVRDAFLDEKKFETLFDGGYEETYKKWVAFLKEEIETDSTVYEFVLGTIK